MASFTTTEGLYQTSGYAALQPGPIPDPATFIITADPDDGVLSPGDDVTIMFTAPPSYSTPTSLEGGLIGGGERLTFAGTTPEGYLVFDSVIFGLAGIVLGDGCVADLHGAPRLVAGVDFDSVTPLTLCFAEGTMIATPEGEVEVEHLRIGDKVLTAEGRAVPLKWIGRQTVMTRFGPAERLMPVRFAAGSLGGGLPHADLTVTADHGMLVDGVICHAGALVNGTTITRVPLSEMGPRYTVYHIETEAHEIILANGAPSETFIDNASRRTFDNFAEFEALYGDVPEMEELPYPRAMSARQVPQAIRAKLGGRQAA